MNLKTPFSVPNKKNNEIDYIKEVYKKHIQNEIDTFIDQEEKPDSVLVQDILFIDRIFI